MKSLVSSESDGVGLLLFNEPSASLDPRAEHDLFTRLRELRGSKTMLFSSHRFGKLTRYADLILCAIFLPDGLDLHITDYCAQIYEQRGGSRGRKPCGPHEEGRGVCQVLATSGLGFPLIKVTGDGQSLCRMWSSAFRVQQHKVFGAWKLNVEHQSSERAGI